MSLFFLLDRKIIHIVISIRKIFVANIGYTPASQTGKFLEVLQLFHVSGIYVSKRLSAPRFCRAVTTYTALPQRITSSVTSTNAG